MSGITFTIRHIDRLSEAYAFACAHGAVELSAVTDTAEAMELVARTLQRMHEQRTKRCGCRVVRMVDEWARLSDAQEQYSEDTNRITPGGRYDSPVLREHHDTTRRELVALGCGMCKPGVRMTHEKGDSRMALVHQRGCPAGTGLTPNRYQA